MHQNGDYQGICEYFVNAAVFCSLKETTPQLKKKNKQQNTTKPNENFLIFFCLSKEQLSGYNSYLLYFGSNHF